MSPSRTGSRWLALLVLPALALPLAACSGEDDPAPAKRSTGLLEASDMPFEDPKTDPLPRPPILTQLGTACLGIEQGVLYDTDWKVTARQFYDSFEWSVISASFTPPAGTTAEEGLAEVRSGVEACAPREKSGRVVPLDLGAPTYAYEITTTDGAFDAARAYRPLADGTLAQVSVMKLPKGETPTSVLKDLVDDLD